MLGLLGRRAGLKCCPSRAEPAPASHNQARPVLAFAKKATRSSAGKRGEDKEGEEGEIERVSRLCCVAGELVSRAYNGYHNPAHWDACSACELRGDVSSTHVHNELTASITHVLWAHTQPACLSCGGDLL